MSTFLILGKPRSRTAWAANLLSTPPASLCLHEGLADAGLDYERLRDRMDSLPATHVGTAETGFIHAIDKMLVTWPDARIVVMSGGSFDSWRPGELIRQAVNVDYDLAVEQLQGYAYFCDAEMVTREESEGRRLWEHCLPTVPFCAERWRILKDLNVQCQLETLRRRYEGSR